MRMLNLWWKSVKQLVSRGIWVLVRVLVGYGIITIVWGYERSLIEWFAIPIAGIFIRGYYLQYINVLSLGDRESVVVSPTITVHTLRKKEGNKTVLVLTRHRSSLVPLRSLNWLNGWGRENIFGVDCWDEELLSYRGRECCWGL